MLVVLALIAALDAGAVTAAARAAAPAAPVASAPAAAPAAAAPPTGGAANARLLAAVATADDYARLIDDVLAWHHTLRNACTAVASTALRRAGVELPRTRRIRGYNPSRITLALAWFLEDAGWQRIDDVDQLAPGDVVFSADDPCCEGFPEHVFVFAAWDGRRGRARRVARVIDNQGFRHARALAGGAGGASPFHFALRDPTPAPAP